MSVAHIKRARAALDRGDIAGAERILTTAFPNPALATPEAHYLFGLIRRAQRRFDEAGRFFQTAIEQDQAQARYHFALGDLAASRGRFALGADALARALALDPDLPHARRAFARAALNADRFAEAEAAARALIATNPDADAWHILSVALRGQQRLHEAMDAGAEALRLDPNFKHARHDWAVAIGRLGLVEEALAAFEDLAGEGFNAPGLAVNRSAALIELDRLDEAEAVLTQALALHPQDMNAQIALAKVRWASGAREDFTGLYEDAIARNPAATLFRAGCVDLLRAAGFAERAEEMLQKGLQRTPSDPILLGALGALLDDADRVAEALPHLERASRQNPMRAEERMRFIRALLRLGRADEAMTEIAPLRAAAPLDQQWLAFETLALRQLNDPRYHVLCDYTEMVRSYDLSPPPGFGDVAEFNAGLSAALAAYHVARDHPLGQSLRQGTQSVRDLRQSNDPHIRAYFTALREPIADYIATMRAPDHPWSGRRTESFEFAGAWSVRLRPGGHHVNHVHPAGWISSSYYVALPDAVAGNANHEGWIKFGEAPRPMPECGIEKLVEPKVGALVLFPSYMWHGTIPISSGERLSAPFDVVPR